MTLDDAINKYRIVPRLMMIACYFVWIYSAFHFLEWFTAHDWTQYGDAAQQAAVMAFPTAYLGIISTMLTTLQKNYVAYKPDAGPTQE